MGFTVKFNWVLQTSPPEELVLGKVYHFTKTGNRVFPLETPTDLINLEREAIAKIKIISFANTNGETKGEFEVLKIYEEFEKEILSNYWLENQ